MSHMVVLLRPIVHIRGLLDLIPFQLFPHLAHLDLLSQNVLECLLLLLPPYLIGQLKSLIFSLQVSSLLIVLNINLSLPKQLSFESFPSIFESVVRLIRHLSPSESLNHILLGKERRRLHKLLIQISLLL